MDAREDKVQQYDAWFNWQLYEQLQTIMTIVEGQIEPLKKLKEMLDQYGISRFNSISDINRFLRNYEAEKSELRKAVAKAVDEGIEGLRAMVATRQKNYDDLQINILNNINNDINTIVVNQRRIEQKRNSSLFYKLIFYPRSIALRDKKAYLEKNSEKILHNKTRFEMHQLVDASTKLEQYSNNKELIIADRCKKSYKELESTKEVIDGLYTLIAGAIGENSVVKEIQKLSDDYYLFNDFSLNFDPPIYNKNDNDRIYSVQIDHLLVCQAGIFILETKNWSNKSIESLDLRSPVNQIKRTSYALFMLINSDSEYNGFKLNSHHWGDKQIPIRNIIVMTNGKPKEKFKHVKVLSLSELTGYIKYFDQIFSEDEVKRIFEYLKAKQK